MNARELELASCLEWALACIQCHFDISDLPTVIQARAAHHPPFGGHPDLRREREAFEESAAEQDFSDPFADDGDGYKQAAEREG